MSKENQIEQPLTNTIKASINMSDNIVYINPPNGINVMGLIQIKNAQKRYKQEEPKPAYQFVFKHKDLENCYVNHKVASVLGPKSALYATIKSMIPGLFDSKPPTPDQAFEMIQELVGGWFNLMVVTKTFNNDAGEAIKYTKVVENLIQPNNEPAITALGDCREFFAARSGASFSESTTKGAPAINTLGKPEKPSGFESYEDHMGNEKVAYPYGYDLSQIKPERIAAAKKLITDEKGIITGDNGKLIGRTTKPVKPLEKYLMADTLESDTVPF